MRTLFIVYCGISILFTGGCLLTGLNLARSMPDLALLLLVAALANLLFILLAKGNSRQRGLTLAGCAAIYLVLMGGLVFTSTNYREFGGTVAILVILKVIYAAGLGIATAGEKARMG